MLQCILLRGIPGSGKSTWAKQKVAEDPISWVRINNDDLRAMMNGSEWSSGYEKLVTETRANIIKNSFKRSKNVIIDNLNISSRHFDEAVRLAKEVNEDIEVSEMPFYVDLATAIERDGKREGKARVGGGIIKKWWKDIGGELSKDYKPRVEILKKRDKAVDIGFTPLVQSESSPRAIICDLDGTFALIGDRSPYDAARCDEVDHPNWPVIETIRLYHKDGCKIIFCSGREDKDEAASRRFINRYFDGEYKILMRKTKDTRPDDVVKEEIFNEHIRGKYWVKFVLDDRTKVVSKWREMGLVCFQVAPGDF